MEFFVFIVLLQRHGVLSRLTSSAYPFLADEDFRRIRRITTIAVVISLFAAILGVGPLFAKQIPHVLSIGSRLIGLIGMLISVAFNLKAEGIKASGKKVYPAEAILLSIGHFIAWFIFIFGTAATIAYSFFGGLQSLRVPFIDLSILVAAIVIASLITRKCIFLQMPREEEQ